VESPTKEGFNKEISPIVENDGNMQNNIYMSKIIFYIITFLFFFVVSCKEEPEIIENTFLSIDFKHNVDDFPIVLDTKHYYNEAGNKYLINEVKYFISNLHLYKSDGTKVKISQDDGIHYIDMDYSNTLYWNISGYIPEGYYDSLSFVFGLTEKDNQSYRFLNPPESNMAWPQLLGGGYHYMMINGWFERGDTVSAPLNIHLGRGQIYQGSTNTVDSIIGFVDNHFQVMLSKSLLIKRDQTANLTLIMNVENWFEEPFIYDFNYWGSHIMQNQAAMQMLKENGKKNVFSVEAKNL
jgi:hypothetical protein